MSQNKKEEKRKGGRRRWEKGEGENGREICFIYSICHLTFSSSTCEMSEHIYVRGFIKVESSDFPF